MKNKILLIAILVAVMADLNSCATSHHQKDDVNKSAAQHRDEQDHMHDYEIR